ncbi:MAG: hypothetical protein JJU05_12345 [Verrucomicrobia bacterium]|nr:hypothetical protein [Verrucomicrobiota bacterium]MCH8528364.1 hypothetical protein [Kiritimatiellia bacterium]
MKPLFPLLILSVCVTGCVTRGPRYQISVGNEHDQRSIRDVEVLADGRTLHEFSRIGPVKSAALRPRRGAPPLELTVRWSDPEGNRFEQSFNPREDMPVDFQGMIFVKIGTDQRGELMRIASTSDDESILPWNVPESWEGSIGIPGMGER